MLNRRSLRSLAALVSLVLVPAAAQAQAVPDGPVPSAPLPASVRASVSRILAGVFANYQPATGRVLSIQDADGQPAKVWIAEARPWNQQLVLVLRIAADATEAAHGVCGGCIGHALLAVVRPEGDSVSLIAMGQLPRSMSDVDSGDLIGFGGHSSLALDLAPYALNAGEMLIGLRQQTIWRETRGTSLTLYRVEGGGLRDVFQTDVETFEYPDFPSLPRRVVMRSAVVAPVRSSRRYFDLRVTRTVSRCTDRNEDDVCNAAHERVQHGASRSELWRFDGTQYRLVTGR